MRDATAVEEALAYLAGLTRFGIRPTLDRMHVMLEALGAPHSRYPVVHVAGTNGKGSTARFIAGALQEAGLRTGLFTSPHLVRYNERIMIQGAPINDPDLLSLVDEARPLAEKLIHGVGHPTEFEMATVMAFTYFAKQKVDIAVIEVGMGGVWDSTNVVDPCLSVITPIAMDHMDRLGNTLAEIAAQKAGIIKPGRPVVAAAQQSEAAQVIAARARSQQAELRWVCGDQTPHDCECNSRFTTVAWDLSGGRFHLENGGQRWADLHVGMLGYHQIANAALAAVACEQLRSLEFPVGEQHVRSALADVRWPGRLELMQRAPFLLFDGAHNAQGARALAHSLAQLFPSQRKTLVMGMMADKQIDEVLAALLPQAAAVYCTAPGVSRTPPLQPQHLAEHVRRVARQLRIEDLAVYVHDNSRAAIKRAWTAAAQDDVVCVCGSLYLVGETRGTDF